jgi:hypothetical protein
MAGSSRTLNLPSEDGHLMHVNAYMFFEVYCVIFHPISILSTVRIMFYIDFKDFPKRFPLFWF